MIRRALIAATLASLLSACTQVEDHYIPLPADVPDEGAVILLGYQGERLLFAHAAPGDRTKREGLQLELNEAPSELVWVSSSCPLEAIGLAPGLLTTGSARPALLPQLPIDALFSGTLGEGDSFQPLAAPDARVLDSLASLPWDETRLCEGQTIGARPNMAMFNVDLMPGYYRLVGTAPSGAGRMLSSVESFDEGSLIHLRDAAVFAGGPLERPERLTAFDGSHMVGIGGEGGELFFVAETGRLYTGAETGTTAQLAELGTTSSARVRRSRAHPDEIHVITEQADAIRWWRLSPPAPPVLLKAWSRNVVWKGPTEMPDGQMVAFSDASMWRLGSSGTTIEEPLPLHSAIFSVRFVTDLGLIITGTGGDIYLSSADGWQLLAEDSAFRSPSAYRLGAGFVAVGYYQDILASRRFSPRFGSCGPALIELTNPGSVFNFGSESLLWSSIFPGAVLAKQTLIEPVGAPDPCFARARLLLR